MTERKTASTQTLSSPSHSSSSAVKTFRKIGSDFENIRIRTLKRLESNHFLILSIQNCFATVVTGSKNIFVLLFKHGIDYAANIRGQYRRTYSRIDHFKILQNAETENSNRAPFVKMKIFFNYRFSSYFLIVFIFFLSPFSLEICKELLITFFFPLLKFWPWLTLITR